MAAMVGELATSKTLLWFIGFVAALLGAVSLAFYSTWSMSWPVPLTILGWLALLKGAATILFPGSLVHSSYRRFKTSGIIMFSGAIAFIVGLILVYKGFLG